MYVQVKWDLDHMKNILTDCYGYTPESIEYADYLLICRKLDLPIIVKVHPKVAISFLGIKGDENEVLSWIDNKYGNGFKSISFTEMVSP